MLLQKLSPPSKLKHRRRSATPTNSLHLTTHTMAAIDLQAVHDTLVSVAFEAGRMILAANPSSIPPDTKMNGAPRPPRHPPKPT